jgi:hypothetical protein
MRWQSASTEQDHCLVWTNMAHCLGWSGSDSLPLLKGSRLLFSVEQDLSHCLAEQVWLTSTEQDLSHCLGEHVWLTSTEQDLSHCLGWTSLTHLDWTRSASLPRLNKSDSSRLPNEQLLQLGWLGVGIAPGDLMRNSWCQTCTWIGFLTQFSRFSASNHQSTIDAHIYHRPLRPAVALSRRCSIELSVRGLRGWYGTWRLSF